MCSETLNQTSPNVTGEVWLRVSECTPDVGAPMKTSITIKALSRKGLTSNFGLFKA